MSEGRPFGKTPTTLARRSSMNQITAPVEALESPLQQGQIILPPEFHVTCFIGRFQPFHFGHYTVIMEALKKSKRVILLIGSSGEPRTEHNPFSYAERRKMILEAFSPEDAARIVIKPLYDWTYQDDRWVEETQRTVQEALLEIDDDKSKIALIGHHKDGTSYYLSLFPMWNSVGVDNYLGLSATNIRKPYFSNIKDMWLGATREREDISPRDRQVTKNVHDFLVEFGEGSEYKRLMNIINWDAESYKRKNDGVDFKTRFPWKDVCVDAVIEQQNHILLVKRKGMPGDGLWALPGGHVEEKQTIIQALLAEINQETSINLSDDTLLAAIKAQHVFDDPLRAPRGRVISHAFYLKLKGKKKNGKIILPTADGGKDPDGGTSRSKWWPIGAITRDMMFDDHFYVIMALRAMSTKKEF